MKKVLNNTSRIFIVFAVILLICFGSYLFIVATAEVKDINFNENSDGFYEGEFSAIFISAKVRTKIQNGKIIEIEVLKNFNIEEAKAKELIKHVIDEQRLNIDTEIEGGNSGIILIKAIEKSLQNDKN